VKDPAIPPAMAQCDAINYQEILDLETRPVPQVLRERSVPDLGTDPVSVDRYVDQDFFDLSIDRMWLKTWQMVCREEEIPKVGDFMNYDIVGKSLIIVRSGPEEFKALHNSCLHRGRKLVTEPGHAAVFRCPYHGFTWKRDGSFLRNPVGWDFPQCKPAEFGLPEAMLARWGGFIFVNFDKNARPLEQMMDPIPRHFERWNFKNKYIAMHVVKGVKCNWSIALEAFVEPYHTAITHPQIIPFMADANAQFDIYSPHVMRHIGARGFTSPQVQRKYTQDEIAKALIGPGSRIHSVLGGNVDQKIPEGMTARSYAGSLLRQMLEKDTGYDCDYVTDTELFDDLQYEFFPNLLIFGGFGKNFVFRFRPVDKRPDESIMELYFLKTIPKGEERPPPAKLNFLGPDDPWASATELGNLGQVLDQDWSNLPQTQEGLEASATKVVNLGHYLDMVIRRHHMTLDTYMRGERPA
jgi:nitrite reductase/ring-hydroxylating ferredoxin subunit